MAGGEDAPPPSRNDHNSPFFLGSQDRPGDLITPVRLRNNNYDEWARSVRLALLSRRKFGFVDGTILEPKAPFTTEDWQTIHSMLVSWIMHTIDPEVKSTISFTDDAKLLWDELKTRFSVINGPRIQQLKSDIVKCEQPKTMSISTYFGKIKVLWDELANHEPIITCKCGKCECNLGKVHEQRRNDERLHQFLMGLNSEYYTQLRSALLSQEPLPSLDRAYQQVTQEERIRGITRAKESPPEVVGFAIRPEGRGRGRQEKVDKSGLLCSHCHRTGHDIVNCFQLLGYPEWWGDRPRTQGTARGRGGSSRATESLVVGRGRGATVRAVNVDASNSIVQPSTPSPVPLPTMTTEQWQSIAAMFGNLKSSSTDRLHGEFFSTSSWIIDTGASNHVTGDDSYFFDVHNIVACPVGLPDGQQIVATKEGSVMLAEGFCLKNVLYVPKLHCNLISVTQLIDDMKCFVQFASNICVIQDHQTRKQIGTGERRDGLYFFKQPSTVHAITVDGSCSSSSVELWHRRLGHPSEKVVKSLPFFRNSSDKLHKPCDICPRAKQTRDSFPISDNKASRIFELIHCDLWGPYHTVSSCGARYFLTIVDDFSRAVWVFLLIDKLEVFQMFMSFFAMVDRQFGQKVKVVRSDNGTEFNCLKDYFLANGILFQTSCVGTPQQNGRVERKHRHILSVARALRFQGHLPLSFWGECILAASHLINRTPSSVLENKTPYEMLFHTLPNFNELRVIGSLAYAHNQRAKSDKFASRSRKCVFVGYPYEKKGWRLYDLETKTFFVSRDVQFFENHFPFNEHVDTIAPDITIGNMNLGDDDFAMDNQDTLTTQIPNHQHPNTSPQEPTNPISLEPTQNTPPDSTPTTQHEPINDPTNDTHITTQPDSLQNIPPEPTTEPSPIIPHNPILESSQSTNNGLDQPSIATQDITTGGQTESISLNDTQMGRGFRNKFPSVLLRDYVTSTVRTESPSSTSSSSPVPSSSSGTPFPITHYINCDRFSVRHRKFLAAILTGCVPKSFKEAMTDEGWRSAMQDEIRALEDNGTWTMEKLPPGKRALGNQWIYVNKYDEDGNIVRLKARLVVFGNHQVEGLDYYETFAPVAKMVTVRAFLAIAASKNWELHQMDVRSQCIFTWRSR